MSSIQSIPHDPAISLFNSSPQFAPADPAPKVPGLFDEEGDYLLTFTGDRFAFGFRGEPDFVQRGINWAFNRGVVGSLSKAHYIVEQQIGYVIIKNVAEVERGLKSQFRSEIIRAEEVPVLQIPTEENGWEVQYDEERIDRLAAERTERFMRERVDHDLFLRARAEVAPVYEMVQQESAEE